MSDAGLAAIGLVTILAVLAAILTKRLSPLAALTLLPLVAAVLLGRAGEAGKLMQDGIVTVAPMAAMFLFAILFFSILAEAGLFEPVIGAVQRFAGNRPARVALGTAVLTSIVHLDGSGAATFLIVIPALAPIYDRLGLDRRMLARIVAMAAGVGNMLPWGGPTIRAATALNVPVMDLFGPVIPVYLAGVVGVMVFSWWIGMRQPVQAAAAPDAQDAGPLPPMRSEQPAWRNWFNFALVVATLCVMLGELAPPAIAFLVATVLALVVNFPRVELQWDTVARHAPSAISMVAILFAAGCFTGLMRGTGMITALAQAAAHLLPAGAARLLPLTVSILAMPLSLLFDPDSFYFGILPLLGGVAQHGGVPAIDVGRAAILGQMTTGFPVSPMTPATFLLVGLAKVDLGDHQRYAIPYLFALSMVMTVAALAFGVIGW